VKQLTDWVGDAASPDRVWSLVAAGGTGKTAIVERVVRNIPPGEANVLVWSFYERPQADAFLRECNQLFLGEERGPAGGRLERLERGLRDGRPHLIVLDGLERVQEDADRGRVRGELSDHTLKLLLRALAAGLGRTRALVTSRFPLVDLQDGDRRGYRETNLDDLSPAAAVAVRSGARRTSQTMSRRSPTARSRGHSRYASGLSTRAWPKPSDGWGWSADQSANARRTARLAASRWRAHSRQSGRSHEAIAFVARSERPSGRR